MTMVIVGAGLAGAKAAQALRDQGFDGEIVLIGGEAWRPYERPPLSKEYLNGKSEREKMFVHPESWYADNSVDLRSETTAVSLDKERRVVRLADGSDVGYDKLLLATGSSPRRLPIHGGQAANLAYLRTISDSDRLRESFAQDSRLVVVGGGWIGLEVAAGAREAGVDVTVIEAERLPLLRVLGPEMATRFADLHRLHGVDLRLGASVGEFVTEGDLATGVRLSDGSVVEGDTILVAVGAAPNTALAEAAGLVVDDGVVTDARLRTSDPDVFAAGDIARAFHPDLHAAIRVEHWANALNQPAVAASSMLGGTEEYRRLPYFYTDQYDLGMEYTGYLPSGGYDQVVCRGDVGAGEYIAFWLSEGRVLAGMNVNVWDVVDPIRDLISSGAVVDTARLTDPDLPLEEVLAG
jgi:3-phenylpropionate/trans-cinnamate dioxygenase ferredoxin reductase subunit